MQFSLRPDRKQCLKRLETCTFSCHNTWPCYGRHPILCYPGYYKPTTNVLYMVWWLCHFSQILQPSYNHNTSHLPAPELPITARPTPITVTHSLHVWSWNLAPLLQLHTYPARNVESVAQHGSHTRSILPAPSFAVSIHKLKYVVKEWGLNEN